MNKYFRGFTLIELLVVVLIIGILAAIAVPQYQKAVLKSRFSSLMPTTQAIRDGQEIYYMTNGRYADGINKLDVTTANTEDMTLTLSDDDDYAYTMATRPNINSNLIMYQKHSVNYAGEVHCEALKKDTQANWLCEHALKGNDIGPVLNRKYTTYVIQGNGAGIPLVVVDETMNCDKAIEMGFTCTVNDEETEKKICRNGWCRTKILNEEGGYISLTCKADEEGKCISTWSSTTYDANGNKVNTRTCLALASDGSCKTYSNLGYDYTYDGNGNQTRQRKCTAVDSEGVCTAYGSSTSYDFFYDENGNRTVTLTCNTMESNGTCSAYASDATYKTYDKNGNPIRQRTCQTVAADGSCSVYGTSNNVDYIYAGGKLAAILTCNAVDSDGSCSKYSSGRTEYFYDSNGNQTGQRYCQTVNSNGSCSKYSSMRTEYIYDTNGNKTKQRSCTTIAANGTCSAYGTSSNYDYMYDANGNKTRERTCSRVGANGNCSSYSNSNAYDYTYDGQGNVTSKRQCGTVNTDGSCRSYTGTTTLYIYDEEGKQLLQQYCSGSKLNTTTGECNSYNVTVYG